MLVLTIGDIRLTPQPHG